MGVSVQIGGTRRLRLSTILFTLSGTAVLPLLFLSLILPGYYPSCGSGITYVQLAIEDGVHVALRPNVPLPADTPRYEHIVRLAHETRPGIELWPAGYLTMIKEWTVCPVSEHYADCGSLTVPVQRQDLEPWTDAMVTYMRDSSYRAAIPTGVYRKWWFQPGALKWFVAAGLALIGLALAPWASFLRWREQRRLARVRANQCIRCGYDLRAIVEGRCPECGHQQPQSSPDDR